MIVDLLLIFVELHVANIYNAINMNRLKINNCIIVNSMLSWLYLLHLLSIRADKA